MVRLLAVILSVFALASAPGQGQTFGPQPWEARAGTQAGLAADPAFGLNPLRALSDAGSLLSGASDLGSRLQPGTGNAGGAVGEERPGGPGLSVAVNIMLLLTVVALVPSIMLMTTSFVRILVVLALLRQAMGTQSLPPAQVITGLAMFMTALIMKPTIDRIWIDAVVPYQNGEIRSVDVLWERGVQPVRDFMFDQIEATGNWSSLYMILNYQGIDTSEPQNMIREEISTTSLVPAYMLSELKIAFVMGFRVYLPFLVIDMVIASLLISMSMMMLPPVLISLPFKLMLFVLVDGWTLIIGSLLDSFVVEGDSTRASAVPAAMLLFLVWNIRRDPTTERSLRDDPPRARASLRALLSRGRTRDR